MTETEFLITLGSLLMFFILLTSIGIYVWIDQKRKLLETIQTKNELINHSSLRLEASQTQLTVTLDFKEKIIKIIIHDLQSPLLFINRISKTLSERIHLMDAEEARSFLTEIYSTSEKCAGFITDMLAWIHSSQQHFSAMKNTFEFVKFLREKCGIYLAMADKKGLSFTICCDEKHLVHTDYAIFSIIIRNLLDNAVKHTVKGGITVEAYTTQQHQVIIVSDTGKGMSTDKMVEIETGVIATRTTSSGQLGFRIIHDMILKLNGKIKVRSALDKGTSIHIELPL